MRRTKLNFDKFHWASLPALAAVAILFAVCFPIGSMAQQPGQKTFSSPEDASNALVTANTAAAELSLCVQRLFRTPSTDAT